MASHGYEEVDHTADVALKVWGEDFQTLLSQAAEGLYALMNVESSLNAPVETSFVLPVGSYEDFLVDFLNELLYLLEEKGQKLSNFAFTEYEDRLEIKAMGEEAQSQDRYIKAVTFHNLNVEKSDRGLEVIITFDV